MTATNGSESSPSSPHKRLGPYDILAKLGSGGMGEVYKARDTRLDRMVAIKVLPAAFASDQDRLRRFEKEAKAASLLNHPNITAVYDIGSEEGIEYVVQELLEGETLRSVLAGGRLPARKAADYGVQLADGLAAAHERGIVHRDLKPENLFVTRDGRAKILDFGLAKLTSPDEAEPPRTDARTASAGTHAGMVLGTVGYMSPEQVNGRRADARSDIFSFGAVLYEMFYGERAFKGDSAAATMSSILNDDPPHFSTADRSVSPAIARIVRRCLEKNPNQRFQSARDLGFALSESGSASRRVSAVPAWRMIALAGAAAILIIALALTLSRQTRTPGPRRIQSLAVLPLANFSRDPDQEFFADGMTDELITDLSQIASLRVISRTSVMPYKKTNKSLTQIGRELHVDGVLEGSVERAGNRVRITAQLLDASTDHHLWARSYERDLRDVLSLQSEVAQAVAREVQAVVTPGEKRRLLRAAVDPEVHDLYLKGRYQLRNAAGATLAATHDEVQTAIDYFQRALAKDAAYAPAYSGLADSYAALTDYFAAPSETMPKAKEMAKKAIELDDNLAEAHTSLGLVLFQYDWNWAGAEKELRRAIELNPNYAAAREVYGDYLADIGRHTESQAEMRKARELDPLSTAIHFDSGWNFLLARENDQSISEFRRAVQIDPAFGLGHAYLGIAYLEAGRLSEAVAEADKALQFATDIPLIRASAGSVLAAAGERARALRILDELKGTSRRRYVCPYEVAAIYVGLGEKDEAFRWLEEAYRVRSDCMQYLKYDPRLAPLRGDPRFNDLLRRMAFPN